MRLTVVVGNPKPASRTLTVANALADRIAPDAIVFDLARYAHRLFAWDDADVQQAVDTLCSSDVAIVASPTFKASYTGMLKAFLDRVPTNGMRGVVAIPVMMGAAPIHYLAPEVHLRPVLVEAGASCPTRALYVQESDLPDLDALLDEWMAANGAALPLSGSRRIAGC